MSGPSGAPSEALRRLAAECRVDTEYWDWQGRHVEVSATTLRAVLAALGVDASSDPACEAELQRRHDEAWTSLLPPYVVMRTDLPRVVQVHVDDGAPVELWIELEPGTVGSAGTPRQVSNDVPAREVGGRRYGEASVELPAGLPLGYHRLVAVSGDRRGEAQLIVTPARVGLPDRLGPRPRWGLATQLYSVRSAQSWGVGDLADLSALAQWAALEHDAAFVLVNPLHAAAPTVPMEPSPYLPTTRRFANPLYLRVEDVPDHAYLDSSDRDRIAALGRRVRAALDGRDEIDRDTAWTAKLEALEILHAAGLRPVRELALRAYCAREGTALDDFATWCVLCELHGTDRASWPAPLRDPASPAVAEFRREHAGRVDFFRWLQWVLDEQLARVQADARAAGMPLGVVHDLAVGVNPDGADAWALQDALAAGVTVGAPPDPYSQTGQDWQQPPWRPDRLAALGYAPLRDMIRAVLRHAGGLRVDHVIGLFRLWWIPAGLPATEGTYVRYDHEAAIGILALEAVRADAVIIGEDLGTVEPWVRDVLRERGLLGTSILWFEYAPDGSRAPLPPEHWRELCLASVTTHDLPPTAGYLAGDHVRLRHELGLLTRPLDVELAADSAEQQAWLDVARSRGLLAGAPDSSGAAAVDGGDPEETVVALHRLLTGAPSRLRCLALTDAVGDRRTQNQPGTRDEYPNWRVPLTGPDGAPVLLEDIVTSARAARLAEIMRGGPAPG